MPDADTARRQRDIPDASPFPLSPDDEARRPEAAGFATVCLDSASAGALGLDVLTALAVVGRATKRIEFGTAIVPTYPRRPMALARQAATVQAVCGGRLVLGVGPSCRPETAWPRPVVIGPRLRRDRATGCAIGGRRRRDGLGVEQAGRAMTFRVAVGPTLWVGAS